MEKIRDYLEKVFENPPIMGIIGLVIGIAFGLLYAWVIDPTDFTDAAITHLREDLKVEYLRLTVDSYTFSKDVSLAKARWERLGEEGPYILEKLEKEPQGILISDIDAFNTVIGITLIPDLGEVEEEVVSEDNVKGISIFFKWGLVITTLLAGALVYRYLSSKRTSKGSLASHPQDFVDVLETTDYTRRGEGQPMHQFTTTYVLGDNLFDDSFSIESAAGEFLGECGIGISESIGVGEPKRVTAFEVWLFDQNDITTITKVLLSGHAYHDEAMLLELEKKGEPILANDGTEFTLETNNLRIIARVMDMVYGEGPLPEESFFERMALELSIWRKTQVDSFAESEYGAF